MSSSNATAKEALAAPSALAAQEQTTTISGADGAPLLEEDHELEADDDRDLALGTDISDTTSIASSIFRGLVENGRRYQTVREGEYLQPSDDQQYESFKAGHIVYTLLDARQKNPFFRSPIPDTAQNILDLGTGPGEWARQVADMYPSAFVQGVDLYPPPDTWVPPNCKFEVDDILKKWMYTQRFDLIHLRDMFATFTDEQWRLIYKQAYDNLLPGGWIEQAETGISWMSDDGTCKPDSIMGQWGERFTPICAKIGKPCNTIDTFRASIEKAGFTDIHEKLYKVPVGDWTKNPLMKEVGRFHKRQILEGLEGYLMFIMTKFGDPEPWTVDEVQVFLAKTREEIENPKTHFYVFKRRVWAQKPLDA